MSQSTAQMTKERGPLTASMRRFGHETAGNLTVFAMILFVLMVMIGGVAVDLMRYEQMRTSLQNTLDRATLASASLSQELDPEDVVNDYFDKAGLTDYLKMVDVSEGINFRIVEADARAETNPFFMHMIGIDEMEAPGHSMAEQRMTNVEIALVLDVSGSMNDNSRLTNLKSAANEFVNTVLSNDSEDRISIVIVPFNGQVNLGPTLRAKYNATNNHGVTNVNCVDLPSSVYNQNGISTVLALPMTAHADTYSTTDMGSYYTSRTDSNYATPNAANRWCPPSTTNTVMLPSNNITALQAKISSLTAIGATSINAGMRWGTTLMDPSVRAMMTGWAANGTINSSFSGRPFEYTDDESMKIVVLMTDGAHFAEERVNDAYKTGTSPIFKSPYDGNYSIRHDTGRPANTGTKKYWVPHRSEWRDLPWTNTSNTGATTLANNPMQWQTVWSEVRLQWVAWQLYGRGLGTNSSQRGQQYNTWLANLRSQTATTAMDSQLQTICTKAKQNGVTVYGIAFEAPYAGQTQISACATSSAHYFNAAGLQIRTAFRAIASNISQLRLTQ